MIGFIFRASLGFLVAGLWLHPAETQAVLADAAPYVVTASGVADALTTETALGQMGDALVALTATAPRD